MAADNRIHMQNDDQNVHQLASARLAREAFGRRLYNLMLKKGWTQSELGRRSGITRGSISNYILGHAVPSDLSLAQLAKALNVSMDTLRPERLEDAIRQDIPVVEFKSSTSNPDGGMLHMNRFVTHSQFARIFAILNENDNGDSSSNAE